MGVYLSGLYSGFRDKFHIIKMKLTLFRPCPGQPRLRYSHILLFRDPCYHIYLIRHTDSHTYRRAHTYKQAHMSTVCCDDESQL